METRSRKRAGASTAATPSTRATKRNGTAASAITTRARQSARSRRSSSSAGESAALSGAAPVPAATESADSSGSASLPERVKPSSGKGKEKEDGSRERKEEVERILGLNVDSDSEDGGGILHHRPPFSSSSVLQGLLRKLGAGFDGLLPSSAISGSSHLIGRSKKILIGLRADGEEGRQMEALTQLCNLLSIGHGGSLSSFPVDSFVPLLVGLLNHESNPDIMLLAARALTYLCDALPSACSAVVQYGAVSSFCARLLTIEYMDLAEQSLQALKKISQEHPTACLRAGALMAVLSYLDFFSTGVQRLALSAAANICKKLPFDAADFVMEAVPLLTNLLHSHDSKVLEHASICLNRIAEALSSSPEKLDELCSLELVNQASSLISAGQNSLSGPTYIGLTRLLSTCASGSPSGAQTLLHLGIGGILKDVLLRTGSLGGLSLSSRPPEQILETVNLADELLPVPSCYSAREKLFKDQPDLLLEFGLDLLPVLIQVNGSSMNSPVRRKCLSAIRKLMYFSTIDMIRSFVGSTNISSFLAGVLGGKDPQVLIPALEIAEILMEKLPELFLVMFVREGVLHAIEELLIPDCADPSSRTSSRSQRYRRRNAGSSCSGSSAGLDVSARAKAFKEKHFCGDSASAEAWGTDDFHRLRNLSTRLNAMVEDSRQKNKGRSTASFDVSANSEVLVEEVISEVLRELCKQDGVSTFEFVRSGIIAALLNYFSCGNFSKVKVSEAGLPQLRQQVLRRFRSFISLSNPSPGSDEAPTVMAILVRKLQSALSSKESFPIVLIHPGSGLKELTKLRKIQFRRAKGEKSLADYSSDIVLIDPFENLVAVEEFLWPRIQLPKSGKESCSSSSNSAFAGLRCSSRSRASMGKKKASSSRGKGKAVLDSGSDDFVGSRTRSAASRRATPVSEDEFDVPSARNDNILVSDDEEIMSEEEARYHEEMLRENLIDIYSPDKVGESKMINVAEDDQRGAHGSSGGDQPKLIFSSCGKQLSRDITVFEAIHPQIMLEEDANDGTRHWSNIYTITYQRANCASSAAIVGSSSGSELPSVSLLDSMLQGELPCDLDKTNDAYGILALLRVLEGMSQLAPRLRAQAAAEEFAEGKISRLGDSCGGARVPAEEFINRKLGSKLQRQTQEEAVLLTGRLPPWCQQLTKACPFLFPLEVRREFFNSVVMRQRRQPRRQKVQVSRDRVLESAASVIEVCSSEGSVLDVEFSGEVGTGLGPTLEFYTILGRELQRAELGLWRCRNSFSPSSEEATMVLDAQMGLFPRPWHPNSQSRSEDGRILRVMEYFSLLGKFMAKAVQDGRLLDLPLSSAFYKLVLGQELDAHDILLFDPEFGTILLEMQALVRRKQWAEAGRLAAGIDLQFRGAAIEELCSDFTLPGYPDYPLGENPDKLVDIQSLEEYVDLVVEATVGTGIRQQMDAFREGFNQVFDISSLRIFSPEELDCLICGRRELWQAETLAENIKFDHGFTAKSPAIINLLEIMGEFTPEQQRAFCQFITGAPRLPHGGLAALSPKLTVVRKHSAAGALDAAADSADDVLPSVMTCANYLKLPAYSTKEIMYKKLIYAISEGQGSFDLS